VRTLVFWAIAALVLVLLFALRIAALSFRAERADYVRTPPTDLSRHPERTGIAGLSEVRFEDADGTLIAGWYVPSRNGAAVVLVHGTGADRSGTLVETGILADAGFGALAIDLPGQGASAGRTRWGVPERAAIRGAVDWLTRRPEVDAKRIGGLGLSMGAYVMTQAAVLDDRLRAVVLAASPSDVVEQNWLASDDWGLLSQVPNYLALRLYGQSLDMVPRDVIGRIAPRPTFIIGGELDTLVPKFMAEQLYAAAGGPKELWIVPGAHHVDYARVAAQAYRAKLVDFFTRTLLN
jgi:dipeptidyl aminopeptidase/acylaminoacyl peptidase